jgi:glycosyltransferase involved in cell wall biosynthesis
MDKMNTNKILFIWNVAPPDGNIGSYRPSVYAAKSIGFDIDIAMNFSGTSVEKRRELENKLGIKLIHVDINRKPYSLENYKAYRQLVSIMDKGKYDIIHCNTAIGSILGRLAAKKAGHNKVFYMNRGFAFYKGAPLKNWIIYYSIEKVFARFFTDAIATINPDDFEIARKFKLRNNSKLKYSIPGPGVELSRFEYNQNDREKIRAQYGIKKNDIVILSVGEISERKNFGSILEALGVINKNNITEDIVKYIYFMIVGEGELENLLFTKAKQLGIEERVIFTGFQEDVAKFYSAADIFALPSLSEGFGRVGIEAMSVGLPLITSNIQGINLYSIDGETGFKYEPKGVNGYAEGIVKLATDEELRNRISDYNKKFSKNFSMEISGKSIAEVYEELMKIPDSVNRSKGEKQVLITSILGIGILSFFVAERCFQKNGFKKAGKGSICAESME